MRIPTAPNESQCEIRKSRFISYALPIGSADEVKPLISDMRGRHPQASHVVHAFLLGEHGEQFGMGDDHEPKHTAGRPMLEVLKGSGLTNILLLVVRYFGGTKLGTGGLVKAYTRAAQEVLEGISSEELVERVTFTLDVPYEIYQVAYNALIEGQADSIEQEFATSVRIRGRLPERRFAEAAAVITEISAGACSLRKEPEPE